MQAELQRPQRRPCDRTCADENLISEILFDDRLVVTVTKGVGTDGRLHLVPVILNDLFGVMACSPHVRAASFPG
jgi:hypothetical protein